MLLLFHKNSYVPFLSKTKFKGNLISRTPKFRDFHSTTILTLRCFMKHSVSWKRLQELIASLTFANAQDTNLTPTPHLLTINLPLSKSRYIYTSQDDTWMAGSIPPPKSFLLNLTLWMHSPLPINKNSPNFLLFGNSP